MGGKGVGLAMIPSLCQFCLHTREVVSGKGSRFLLCEKSQVDRRFPKYPSQPVLKCIGFEQGKEDTNGTPPPPRSS